MHGSVFVCNCLYMHTYYICNLKRLEVAYDLDSKEDCELCSRNLDIDRDL